MRWSAAASPSLYSELDREARGLASWFLRHGARPGDRVAIHSANSLDAVKLMLACFHGGLIAVPVNIRLKAAEVAYILGHSDPVMCFSQPSLAAVAAAACVEGALDIPLHTRLPEPEDAAPLPEFGDDQPALVAVHVGDDGASEGSDPHACQPARDSANDLAGGN